MAIQSVKNLRINFSQDGADKVKATIDDVSAKADKFGKKDVKAKVGVDSSDVAPHLAVIKTQLDALSKKRVELQVGADTVKAQLALAKAGLSIDDLSKKIDVLSRKSATPDVKMRGVAEAQVSLLGLMATMDKLGGEGAKAGKDFDRGVTAPLKDIPAKFGAAGSGGAGSFNKGLKGGGGLGGGAGLMSPQVIVPLVAAGLAVMPGLFAIAGGLAAVALGTALAVKGSPQLQKAGKSLLTSLGKTFEGAAKVLDGPINGAITQIKGQLPQIGALFKTTFSNVAPLIKPLVTMLTEIVTGIMPGFNSLMKQAQGPLSQFFVNAGKIVGSGLGKFLAALGPGTKPSLSVISSLLDIMVKLLPPIARLADQIASVLAPALSGLDKLISNASSMFNSLPGPIKTVIGWLGKVVDPIQNIIGIIGTLEKAWPQLELIALKGLKGIIDGMTDFTGTLLHLASDAFGWIPGIGPKLKAASADFSTWKASVDGSLQSVIDRTQAQIDKSNQQRAEAAAVASSMVAMKSKIDTVSSSLGLNAGQVSKLTDAMVHNKGQVDTSKTAFEQFAENGLGLSKSKADALWASLKNVSGNYAANVKVAVSGGGTVSANVTIKTAEGELGLPTSGSSTPSQQKQEGNLSKNVHIQARAAKGMLITQGTGPTADDVIIAASRGETVVSAAHTRQLAPTFRAIGVPGFASGGLIGASSSFSQAGSVGSSLGAVAEPGYVKNLGASVASAVLSATSAGVKGAQSSLQSMLSGIGSGPLGQNVSGGTVANGREIYQYLLQNVFHGAKIAAAGAIASIYGESAWNPFAQGTGGRGLIGWTPPGTISNAAFEGGLRTQLPAVIKFIGTSGDWGAISEMEGASSILEAANIWGKRVERYGINDVHSAGLALAAQIMGGSDVSVNKKTSIATSKVSGEQTFSGYSYNNGGWVNEPVLGKGMFSGANYSFAEKGPEYVNPNGGGAGGDTINIYVQGDSDPDGAAVRIQQKLRAYKTRHGNKPLGLG